MIGAGTAKRTGHRLAIALLVAAIIGTSGCHQRLTLPPPSSLEVFEGMGRSMLQVNVTRQGFYPRRPWQLQNPQGVSAIGVVLAEGRVLVNAGLVADHRHIELEHIETGAKCQASVIAVDYEADLALLAGEDAAFMGALQAMTLSSGALPGDRLDVLQVQPGGRVVASSATVTTVELSAYPYGYQFLTYRLSGSLQNRYGHLTLPVVRGRRLAGLLKRDDSQNQTLEVTPVELIAHFLKDAGDGRYDGFPLSGIHFVATQDPELRRFIGVPAEGGGVFVDKVVARSAAEKAGIRVGDVITAIDGHAIDNRGFYRDKRLGRIGIAHLIRCGYQVNDRPELTLIRQGRPMTVGLPLDYLPAADYLVPPYQHDRPLDYCVLGGLVFQELSAPYLMDFGGDWTLTAPIHLLYLQRNQFDLNRPAGDKIVILNSVLPTTATIGYETVNNVVVEQINGRRIGRLTDVPPALEHPQNGFHQIRIDQQPFTIYLDAVALATVDAQVRQRYNLPSLRHLGDGAGK